MDRETVLAATDDYGQKQFREVLLAMEDKFETRRKVRTANIEIDLSTSERVLDEGKLQAEIIACPPDNPDT